MKKFTSFADVPDYRALLQQALEIKQNPFGYQYSGRMIIPHHMATF
jgi:N-succinyl-L-ornithine transcarbamylase